MAASSGGGGPTFPSGPGGQTGGGFSGAGIGRISGPLLKDNLLRNGVDLAFETDLLYLNVNDIRIGVKTDSSARELEIVGDSKTTNLIVDDLITATNILINDTSTITTSLGPLYLNAQNSINAVAVKTDNLKIDNNRINSLNVNSNLEFYPTKDFIVNSNVWIDGSLRATGNITFDGDIVFGDSDTDNVNFTADINSSILPNVVNLETTSDFVIGNSEKQWNTLYAKALRGANIVTSTLSTPANINFSLRFSNALFVSTTGSNSNQGDHQNAPYRNLAYAVTQATAGDTIFIYPGTYTEIFPITVPAGVSIVGFDIRTTIIRPTNLTKSKDAFLLNGETAISDLTIRDFFYNSVDNTGHAFRFADNFLVTSRSPYIQNITVITRGSISDGVVDGEYSNSIASIFLTGGTASTISFNDVIDGESSTSEFFESLGNLGFETGDAGKGALIDASVANSTSNEASMLFHSCTFITPGVECIIMTNGVRVEWLNSFTYFADIGISLTQGLIGFERPTGETAPGEITVGPGSTLFGYTSDSVNVDKTFYSQALVDSLVGQIAVIDRYPNPPLFYNIVSIETESFNTNLWRITFDTTFNTAGWLKPISFYPDNGTTFIVPNDNFDTTGSSIGEPWVAYFKSNLPPDFDTVVGSQWSINVAGVVYIVDYVIQDPINSNQWRIYVTTSLVASSGIPIFSSPGVGTTTVYGGELRSIGSANVYGNYGVVADGADTLAYLINHNFGYIGSGADSSNDKTNVVQANEVVELNGGNVYYSSQSQNGDFRIGDNFLVDFQNGAVTFDNVGLAANGLSTLLFLGNNTRTFITADYLETGNFRLSDNKIESLTREFNIQSASGVINFDQDVYVSKNLSIIGDFQTEGTLTFGNQTQDIISFGAKINNDINPSVDGNYDLGSSSKKWKTLYSTSLNTAGVQVLDSQITTIIDGNLTLLGNGTGGVQVETLFFKNSTVTSLSTNNNIIITPNNDYGVVIDKTSAVKLPNTTTALSLTGGIRLNTTTGIFGGFDGISEVGLGGVFSQNRNTSVSIHPTNNITNFTINNVVATTIDPSQLTTSALSISGLSVNNNTISTAPNGNLTIVADNVSVESIVIDGSTISTSLDENIILKSTGQGFISFQNAGGALALPYGTDSERPTNPEIGNARWNTEQGYYEIWNGTQWSTISGSGELATFEYLNEQTTLWSLVMG